MKPELRKRLAERADEIADLSITAKRYANGGAWTMAAAMFHTIDLKARQAKDMAEWKQEETVRVNPVNKNVSLYKTTARKHFSGSRALFDACWRKYMQYLNGAIDDQKSQKDVDDWLEQIASEKVNNSKSRFYIYGNNPRRRKHRVRKNSGKIFFRAAKHGNKTSRWKLAKISKSKSRRKS